MKRIKWIGFLRASSSAIEVRTVTPGSAILVLPEAVKG